MRNKIRNTWYVAGFLLPAVALSCAAIYVSRGDNPLMFLLPAIAAVALFAAAFIVSRAESFALIAKPLWDYGNKPALARWIKSREDRETADAERGTDAASSKK